MAHAGGGGCHTSGVRLITGCVVVSGRGGMGGMHHCIVGDIVG